METSNESLSCKFTVNTEGRKTPTEPGGKAETEDDWAGTDFNTEDTERQRGKR
jgi:hypothetical protein